MIWGTGDCSPCSPPYTLSSLASLSSLSRYLPGFFQGRWKGRKILSSLSGADVLPPTKSCPRLRGKWHGEAMPKGERLKAAKCFYYSPSDNPPKLSPGWNKVVLLTAVRNSPCSCPFSVSLHSPQAALNSEPHPKFKKRSFFRPAGFVAMGRKLLYNACIGAAVCIRAEERLYA